jgi:uncharacterized membrane protein YfcA
VVVGAGGGFVFVPILLIVLNLPPEIAAGTGLVVVMLSALSGVFGYVRQKRIDYNLGVTLAIGAVPGTLIGVWLVQFSSPKFFYWIFAGVLVALGLFLLFKKAPQNKMQNSQETAASLEEEQDERQKDKKIKKSWLLLLGLLLGVVSNYFGIGGGWLLVPILIYAFHIVPHYATATSIFSLCLYSAVGVLTQIYYGNIEWSPHFGEEQVF